MGFDCIDNYHDPVYADNIESSVRGRARILDLSATPQTTSCQFGAPRLSSWLATSTSSEAPPSQILILSISVKVQLPDNRCPICLWVSLLFGFEASSTELWSAPTYPVPPNPFVAETAQNTVSNLNTLIHVVMLTVCDIVQMETSSPLHQLPTEASEPQISLSPPHQSNSDERFTIGKHSLSKTNRSKSVYRKIKHRLKRAFGYFCVRHG